MGSPFSVPTAGGTLVGSRSGSGPPVLVLHGGPGSSDYTEDLETELAGSCELIRYTQRGLTPSLTEGPFSIEQHVGDAIAVLDGLGIERAWILGHSWGGHLGMHLVTTHPERALGLISVSALGGAGDGGAEEFEAALYERTPADVCDRARELDERAMRGEGTDEEAVESLELIWPAYFAHPESAPPMPPTRISVAVYSETLESIVAHFQAGTLEAALPQLRMPVLVVHGRQDPIPFANAEATAALIPGVQLEPIEECGHFPWLERPGVLGRLVAGFIS